VGIYKPNSVIDSYLSSPLIALGVKRHSQHINSYVLGTALHSGKDFAVSAGLNRVVSARTSRITPGRRYLLPFCEIAHARHLTM